MNDAPPPVRPSTEDLPLGNSEISFDRFQSFCRDLIQADETVVWCEHYGKQGDPQKGIDLVATTTTGDTHVYQCRRVAKFSGSSAQRVIEGASFPAQEYIILVGCEATASARDAVKRTEHWRLWDRRDLSAMVHQLPRIVAARLVTRHFGPAWCQHFLGSELPEAVQPYEEYFAELRETERLFHHAWPIVGRSDTLKELEEYADGSTRVVLLVGSAGVGKTRILIEFAKGRTLPTWVVADASGLTSADVQQLPRGGCFLIIDDAHRLEGLDVVLRRLRAHPLARLVISCRPHGVDNVLRALSFAGYDATELTRVRELHRLTETEASTLAERALGPEFAHAADRVARAAGRNPLACVVASELVRRTATAPEFLDRDQDFQFHVLSRLRDAALADRIPAGVGKPLLAALAALAPARLSDEPLTKLAELLQLPVLELAEYLDTLQVGGYLVETCDGWRVAPDMFANFSLTEACTGASGRVFLQRLVAHFGRSASTTLLRNLGELDWRTGSDNRPTLDVVHQAWLWLYDDFQAADAVGRVDIVRHVGEVAYFQPKAAIQFVDRVLAAEGELPATFGELRPAHYLTAILQNASFDLRWIHACCDHLWQLGIADERHLEASPKHPLKALSELAGYDLGKPYSVQLALLDRAEIWCEQASDPDHVSALIAVIDPMLASTSLSITPRDDQLNLQPFVVSAKKSASIRARAVALLGRVALHGGLRNAVESLSTLINGSMNPMPAFGGALTKSETTEWSDARCEILATIDRVLRKRNDRMMWFIASRDLEWLHARGYPAAVSKSAARIRQAVPATFEQRLLTGLANYPFEYGNDESLEERGLRRRAFLDALAAEFVELHPAAEAGRVALESAIDALSTNSADERHALVHSLAANQPDYASNLCRAVLEANEGRLVECVATLLVTLQRADSDYPTLELAQLLSESERAEARAQAAFAIRAWVQDIGEQVRPVLTALVADPVPMVRAAALSAVAALGRTDAESAYDLAMECDVRDTSLVGSFALVFDPEHGLDLASLRGDWFSRFADKVRACPELELRQLGGLLGRIARLEPRRTVALLADRVSSAAREGGSAAPFPYRGFDGALTHVADAECYAEILAMLLKQASKAPTLNESKWLGRLLFELTPRFGMCEAAAVEMTLRDAPAKRLKSVAAMLTAAEFNFVIHHETLIVLILNQAHRVSASCFSEVSARLATIATTGIRESVAGKAAARDVAVLEFAQTACRRHPEGSPAFRFYEALREFSARQVEESGVEPDSAF